MRLLPLLMLSSLAGCATPESIYKSEVDYEEFTEKPIEMVSQCLHLRWAQTPIQTADGKIGFLNKNGFQQVLGILTLEPNGSGTKLQFRKTGQLVIGKHDYRKCM